MKDLDSVKSEVFELIAEHFHLMQSVFDGAFDRLDLIRYVIGAEIALKCVFELDYDSFVSMMDDFNTLLSVNFGGEESE